MLALTSRLISRTAKFFFGALLVGCSSLSTADRICSDFATLKCLKKNYATFEKHRGFQEPEYQEFWAILDAAAARMAECRNITEVQDFMDLVSLNPRSAALDEFLSKKIETLVVKNPSCALKGIQRLKGPSKSLVLERLRRPDFVEESQIRQAFSDAQSSSTLKELADAYFSVPTQ